MNVHKRNLHSIVLCVLLPCFYTLNSGNKLTTKLRYCSPIHIRPQRTGNGGSNLICRRSYQSLVIMDKLECKWKMDDLAELSVLSLVYNGKFSKVQDGGGWYSYRIYLPEIWVLLRWVGVREYTPPVFHRGIHPVTADPGSFQLK